MKKSAQHPVCSAVALGPKQPCKPSELDVLVSGHEFCTAFWVVYKALNTWVRGKWTAGQYTGNRGGDQDLWKPVTQKYVDLHQRV